MRLRSMSFVSLSHGQADPAQSLSGALPVLHGRQSRPCSRMRNDRLPPLSLSHGQESGPDGEKERRHSLCGRAKIGLHSTISCQPAGWSGLKTDPWRGRGCFPPAKGRCPGAGLSHPRARHLPSNPIKNDHIFRPKLDENKACQPYYFLGIKNHKRLRLVERLIKNPNLKGDGHGKGIEGKSGKG